MDYKMLVNVIQSNIEVSEFLNFHENEIKSYIDNSKYKGSIPIYSKEEHVILHRLELVKILELYLDKKILEWDLEYILSNIELLYNGVDEKVEDVIYFFSNPYLNYHISFENITRAINFLENKEMELKLNYTDLRLKQKGIDIRPNYKTKLGKFRSARG